MGDFNSQPTDSIPLKILWNLTILSPSKKFVLLSLMKVKNDGKHFSFHPKSQFGSQDI